MDYRWAEKRVHQWVADTTHFNNLKNKAAIETGSDSTSGIGSYGIQSPCPSAARVPSISGCSETDMKPVSRQPTCRDKNNNSDTLVKLTSASLKIHDSRPRTITNSVSQTSDGSEEYNVSLVDHRQTVERFGHLPMMEQFTELGTGAIQLQTAELQTIFNDLIRSIERNFPHGIRSTTIATSLWDANTNVIRNIDTVMKLTTLFSIDKIMDILGCCSEYVIYLSHRLHCIMFLLSLFKIGDVMELGFVVKFESENYRSARMPPEYEFWLKPRDILYHQNSIDAEIEEWFKSPDGAILYDHLNDKVAFLINEFIREIVINLTRHNYSRNIYVCGNYKRRLLRLNIIRMSRWIYKKRHVLHSFYTSFKVYSNNTITF